VIVNGKEYAFKFEQPDLVLAIQQVLTLIQIGLKQIGLVTHPMPIQVIN